MIFSILIKRVKESIDEIVCHGTNISLYLSSSQRESTGVLGEYERYSISSFDGQDKYSKSFHNCLGVVIMGQEKATGKPLSLLTHQNPSFFLNPEKNPLEIEQYKLDIKNTLNTVISSSGEGSLEVFIVGGQYVDKDEYTESVRVIACDILLHLGVEPTILAGPNVFPLQFPADIYLDTSNRRMYLARPENPSVANESFSPDEVEQQWQEIEKIYPKFKPGNF